MNVVLLRGNNSEIRQKNFSSVVVRETEEASVHEKALWKKIL